MPEQVAEGCIHNCQKCTARLCGKTHEQTLEFCHGCPYSPGECQVGSTLSFCHKCHITRSKICPKRKIIVH